MNCEFHIRDEAQLIGAWVATRIPGCERGFGASCAMSISSDDEMVAGVVFHNYSPEAGVMEMSAASDDSRWLSKNVIRRIHEYIFDDAECQMSVMRVSEENTRMLSIGARVGYTPYLIPRLRGRYEAEVIMTLTDTEWRQSRFSKRLH